MATSLVIVCNLAGVQHVASAQLIVAHRGASEDAPENTLAAFRLAWEQGADAVEGDFYLTKDQQIVALHDKTTERTAGVNWDVREQPLARLQTLDVGKWKAGRFAGERIPTLAQVCDVVSVDGKLVLEVKDSPRIVPFIIEAATSGALKSLLPDRLIIISFDANVIAACRKSMPDVKAFWLTSFKENVITGEIEPSIDSIIKTLHRIDATGLDCKASDHIDESFVQELRNEGFEFHVYTIDSPQVAQRFQHLGVDSITTNRPAAIRRSLNAVPVAVP
jgi:glycerophosphoryl diester phosphodiesterase